MSEHMTSPASSRTDPAPEQLGQSGGAGLFLRLAAMMFMHFVVFGSFNATLGLVLSTHGLASVIGIAFSVQALAAVASPMLLGAIGDRFLPSQRVLGIAHLIGGALLLVMPYIIGIGDGVLTLGMIFLYMVFLQPTLALTNQITLRHLGGNSRVFPYIRVFGTAGWVVVGLAVGAAGLSASTGVFVVGAVASFLLGLYAFTLPNTPPAARGARFSFGDIVGSRAFVLLRDRNFLVFSICILLTCVPLGMYNSYASPFLAAVGVQNVAGVLSIGQVSELVFIVTIPFVLRVFGMKWSLLFGMLMWGVRFAVFVVAAQGVPWVAIAGVALHGICSDFFLILGAMYVNAVAPVQLKARAQSYFIFLTSGLGTFLGSLTGNFVYNLSVGASAHPALGDWAALWAIPIAVSVVVSILFIALFRSRAGARGIEVEPISLA